MVQQFCEKHLDKIKNYIKNISFSLAMPAEETILNRSYQYFNTIERKRQSIKKIIRIISYFVCLLNRFKFFQTKGFFSKKFKNKKFCSLNFACQCKNELCLYSRNYFEIVTFFPSVWIHIIFLSIQVKHKNKQ